MIGCRRAAFKGSKSNSNIWTRLAASSRLSLSFFALAGWAGGIPNLLFSCTRAMFAMLSLVFYWIGREFTFAFRSFDIERSDGRSSLTLHISVAGQWLSSLRVNPYPTRDCLRLNNRVKLVKNEKYSLYWKYCQYAYPWNSSKVVHVRGFQRQLLACKPHTACFSPLSATGTFCESQTTLGFGQKNSLLVMPICSEPCQWFWFDDI